MSAIETARAAHLRLLESAAERLARALNETEHRARRVRDALAAGRRVTGEISSVLGHAPSDVDVAAGRLDVLLELAPALGIEPDAIMAAYLRGASKVA